MRTFDLIEGLKILQQFRDSQTGFDVGGEHDTIYAYPTDKPLDEPALVRMIFHGWIQEHDEMEGNQDFTVSDYRQDESWIAYT
jgi:hypothetical protein